jgi:guanylate kinase
MKLLFENWRKYLTILNEDGTVKSGNQNGHYSRDTRDNIGFDGYAKSTDPASKTRGGFLAEAAKDTIVAFFGPSGSGKSFAKKYFVDQGWREIRTNTTRPPRGPEDKEYNFWSEEDFKELMDAGKLVNANEYQGNWYGTHVDDLNEPGSAVMLTDTTSLDGLKQAAGDRLTLVHTAPPSSAEMEKRHTKRGTPERIAIAAAEADRDTDLLKGRGDIITIRNQQEIEDLEQQLRAF